MIQSGNLCRIKITSTAVLRTDPFSEIAFGHSSARNKCLVLVIRISIGSICRLIYIEAKVCLAPRLVCHDDVKLLQEMVLKANRSSSQENMTTDNAATSVLLVVFISL